MGPRSVFLSASERAVAKTSPGEFIRQVRSEASKVVWPAWNDTFRTAVMVLIMTAILGIFFFAVDSFFSGVVRFLLGLIA
jgi:preprotein translocase subunit SecE